MTADHVVAFATFVLFQTETSWEKNDKEEQRKRLSTCFATIICQKAMKYFLCSSRMTSHS